MRVSKSNFLRYIQCPKRYWLGVHMPELADERDMTVFTNGTRIGEVARNLFPGGVLLEYREEDNRLDYPRMLSETKKHLEEGTDVIYEASFSTGNIFAICDILVKTDKGYDVYEVKSSGSLKDVYLPDAAFQYHVLKQWGLPVDRVFITHINTGYVRYGELHLEEMFYHNDVTDTVIEIEREIEEALPDIIHTYHLDEAPDIDIDLQCETPYVCEFMGHCYSHIRENSVFEIAGMQQKRKYSLYHDGVVYFRDIINRGIVLKKNAMQQVETALSGENIIERDEISGFLDTLHYPLYFLDFETINPAIPLYDGTSPYQQIPTQYSLHFIEGKDGQLFHREFLAEEGSDPRRKLAEQLANDIPENACVLAYHMAFEKKVIAGLAKMFPDLSKKLMSIHDNARDLIIPFRKRYLYTNEMKGKSSIKSVLPALFPDDPMLSYENLEGVHNGNEASNAYLSLTDLSPDERAETKKQLLEYCKLDTLAMVKIWEKLKEIT